jgi:chromate transporter
MTSSTTQRPTPRQLLLIFSRIGLTSFGGGLSGWLLREFVQSRKWLSHDEFLNGLAISQALPGVNVTNMAIWIGYRLLRGPGAIASLIGIVVPAAVVIVLLGALFSSLVRFPVTHLALQGAAAAATGLSLSMCIVTARHVQRTLVPIVIFATTFVAVGILRWPLPWVLLGVGSLSVGMEYLKLRGA